MSNDILANYSLNPNSISDFTGVNVSEGCARNLVNNGMRQFASTVKANFAANAGTITSASTLVLASISTGDYIFLTPSGGSSSITSFGTATEGLSKRLEALGTVILRNSANMLLPGGSDLTISTGDVITTRALGSTVHKVTHEPYNGVAQSVVNAASITASATSSLLILSGGSVSKADASAIADLADTGLPPGYLYGLGISNAADTDHDITAAVGECRDFADAYDMALSGAITKQIDAAWAVGTNQGGLFSGTVANTTWYHFFLIRRSDTGVVDAGFDTSFTAANIPANYDAYRRLGSVLTNGSANILQFVQNRDEFQWNSATPPVDYNTTISTTPVTITLSTPPGIKTSAHLSVLIDDASTCSASIYSPSVPDPTLSLTVSPLPNIGNPGANPMALSMTVETGTSSNVRAVGRDVNINALRVMTTGWRDFL